MLFFCSKISPLDVVPEPNKNVRTSEGAESLTSQGGARFALQVEFRTPERIGPRTMTLVAGSLQYL
jgi:hypothetical protein